MLLISFTVNKTFNGIHKLCTENNNEMFMGKQQN